MLAKIIYVTLRLVSKLLSNWLNHHDGATNIRRIEITGGAIADAKVRKVDAPLGGPYFFGCFLTKFQNPRGSVIVKPTTCSAMSSKSLSPLTRTSALAANAEASIH